MGKLSAPQSVWLCLVASLILRWAVLASPIVGGHVVYPLDNEAIANGKLAKYSFMVSLQDRRTHDNSSANYNAGVDYQHFCGGISLNAEWILTAAHCVCRKMLQQIVVVIGHNDISNIADEDRHMVDHVAYYNFQPGDYENDIALLHLKRHPVNVDKASTKQWDNFGRLPSDRAYKVNRRRLCTIIGYGSTHHGGAPLSQLTEAQVGLITNQRCRQLLGNMWGPQPDGHTVCALGKNQDTCQGDSGGPLICYEGDMDYIHGIVSHGPTCGISGTPSVYTLVAPFTDWIRKTMSGSTGTVMADGPDYMAINQNSRAIALNSFK